MKLITIATFTYPHEAVILKSRLEAEGIPCFAKDELTVQAYPFYSNAIGGVKIQVAEKDIINAQKIVEEYYANTDNKNVPEIPEEEYMHDDAKDSSEKVVCPVCASSNVSRDKAPSRYNIITLMLLGLPLIFPIGKKYHCFNCGHNFKPGK